MKTTLILLMLMAITAHAKEAVDLEQKFGATLKCKDGHEATLDYKNGELNLRNGDRALHIPLDIGEASLVFLNYDRQVLSDAIDVIINPEKTSDYVFNKSFNLDTKHQSLKIGFTSNQTYTPDNFIDRTLHLALPNSKGTLQLFFESKDQHEKILKEISIEETYFDKKINGASEIDDLCKSVTQN